MKRGLTNHEYSPLTIPGRFWQAACHNFRHQGCHVLPNQLEDTDAPPVMVILGK